MTSTNAPEVFAIVPLAEFGGDDLVLLHHSGDFALPSGCLAAGERVLLAAERIVLEATGLTVASLRLLYVLEREGRLPAFGVLCGPPEINEDAMSDDVTVAPPADLEGRFRPPALREVLAEDVRSGCVRPVAHIIESGSGERRTVDVIW